MYCLMSALSTNAKSIFSVTLDVVRITTLECLQYGTKVGNTSDTSRFQNVSDSKAVEGDRMSVKRTSAIILL